MPGIITSFKPFLIATLGGVTPTLLWLWFWHRQDSECPEPKGLIFLSFLAGIAVVFFVLPVQKLIITTLPYITDVIDTFASIDPDVLKNILLAATEEIGKYATVFLIAIQSKYFDEPIDAVIYLITAALGFAAIENTLYILKDLAHGGMLQVVINSNLRFLGATLLHTVSSAFVGIAIACAFYAPRWIKMIAVLIGIAVATLLHTHFNLTIIETSGTLNTLAVFSRYWIAIVGIVIIVAALKYFFKKRNICNII